LLEQLVAYYGTDIKLDQVQAMLGITGDVRAQELARHIVDKDIAAGLQTINSVTQDGLDLRQFNRELVEYLRGLLLIKAGAAAAIDLPPEALSEMKGLAETAPMAQLSKAARLFRQVELEFDGFSPLPLELAMVECALPEGRPAMPATPATPATPIKAKKIEVEPVTTAAPTEEKPAMPTKAKKTEEEPVTTPAPIEEKPATPDKFEKFEKTDIEYFRSRWREVVNATRGMGSQ
ncbi:unnamed protein product, partial [marine sediment metagenome]